ncbi:MAG TPA: STT3 domain-containing protein [Thermoanaerobaculia bacterium]|nr:STT3 domain-containing protein [Thermoanaerobaculia bacterium]
MASRKVPWHPFLLAVCAFVMALTLRISNAPIAFADGVPLLTPLDELYHWKRMTWSAQHWPTVLEFDRDRGVQGAFCPWPPLYDFAAGTAARLRGARLPADVLAQVAWFPPILGALFVAIATGLLARHADLRVAIASGIALAASPFVATQCWIGSIDHHFLEWPLTFAVLGATCLALRGTDRRSALIAGILLGAAITAAMFAQTALLVAAALAFAILFFFSDGKAAAIGFGIAAMAIVIYRVTRPHGYPDSQWFLGYTHVALFAGAAAASLLQRRNRIVALALGVAVVAAVPTALGSIIDGVHFFGGDNWLRTIAEFQPLWKARGEDLASYGAGLSTGAILVWPLAARSIRRRDTIAGAVALFAIVHLALTISSRRFSDASIPLLALAGAMFAASISRPKLAMLALAAVAIPPAVQFVLWMQHPEPPVTVQRAPWLRAATFLQGQHEPGRVLAPWSMGHAIDVIGERPVIVDNFGTMPDPITFERAYDAYLARREDALVQYCRASGVRYVVIENPVSGLQLAATVLGIDSANYVRITGGMPPFVVTRLAQSTWWWHAYFRRSLQRFQLVYSDPQLYAAETPFQGPALMIWEFRDRVR